MDDTTMKVINIFWMMVLVMCISFGAGIYLLSGALYFDGMNEDFKNMINTTIPIFLGIMIIIQLTVLPFMFNKEFRNLDTRDLK